MAYFTNLWANRYETLDIVIQHAMQAELKSESEYKAAVKIQSWFRGCRLRAYLNYLCANAIVIQRHYRGYRGRKAYRKSLKECLHEMRNNYYQSMAAKIQNYWRGYCVRKHVFNYRAYKNYMLALQQNNEIVRARLKEEWEKSNSERLDRQQQLHQLLLLEQARRHHYMLSTTVKEGVFKRGSKSVFEDLMRATHFIPLHPKIQAAKPEDFLHNEHHYHHHHHCHFNNSACCSIRLPRLLPTTSSEPLREKGQGEVSNVCLPPLVQVMGPFKEPEKVWRQRVRPLEPTLRVATLYDSVDIARAKLKAKEWRNFISNEPFVLPYSCQGLKHYEPIMNTSSPYMRPVSENRFRDALKKTFRTVFPPIPIFDRYNLTY